MAPPPKVDITKVRAATPRVALPKSGPWQAPQNGGPARSVAQQLSPARLEAISAQSQELADHIGDRVKITNILYQTFTGTIYSCDTALVLETGPEDYHLIPVSKILKHQLVPNVTGITPTAAEERGRQKQVVQKPPRPEGVSDVGYGLYTALNKTLQVRWENKSIAVMDNVRIEPPYDVDTCSASDKHAKQLERVKQLVKNELLKMEANGTVERRGG